MDTVLRIGNASGFYGDRFAAFREMLEGGHLDVLTGDYLAELTMLILGRQRLQHPERGYATTFLHQMEDCLGIALERGVTVVTNAGGLVADAPQHCARCTRSRLTRPAKIFWHVRATTSNIVADKPGPLRPTRTSARGGSPSASAPALTWSSRDA